MVGNRFLELSNSVNKGVESFTPLFKNKNNIIKSHSLYIGLDQVYNSRESANFYLLKANQLMEAVEIEEFSFENFFNKIDTNNKLYNLLKDASKSETYSKIPYQDREDLDNLYYKVRRNQENISMSLSMEGDSSGKSTIFQSMISTIKKLILAIANFFKGIFSKIMNVFRKNGGNLENAYRNAYSVAGNNNFITVNVVHKNCFNKNFKKDYANVIVKLKKAIEEIRKSNTELKQDVFSKAYKKANSASKISKYGENSKEESKKGEVYKIVFGTSKLQDGQVKAKDYLNKIKAAGIVSFNFKAAADELAKYNSELTSEMTNASNTINSLKSKMNGGSYERLRKVYSQIISNCKSAISFVQALSSTILITFSTAIKVCEKIYSAASSARQGGSDKLNYNKNDEEEYRG